MSKLVKISNYNSSSKQKSLLKELKQTEKSIERNEIGEGVQQLQPKSDKRNAHRWNEQTQASLQKRNMQMDV